MEGRSGSRLPGIVLLFYFSFFLSFNLYKNNHNYLLIFFMLYDCLRVLDGTYIRMNLPYTNKPRYCTRKGDITINALGICSQDMKFMSCRVRKSWLLILECFEMLYIDKMD